MTGMTFDAVDADGQPRLLAGTHRPKWEEVRDTPREISSRCPAGLHLHVATGYISQENYVRQCWERGCFDQPLYYENPPCANPDGWISRDHGDTPDGQVYAARCHCGWRGSWHASRDLALDDLDGHERPGTVVTGRQVRGMQAALDRRHEAWVGPDGGDPRKYLAHCSCGFRGEPRADAAAAFSDLDIHRRDLPGGTEVWVAKLA